MSHLEDERKHFIITNWFRTLLQSNISIDDIIYMLPAEQTAENEQAASKIQALYRGKKQRDAMKEENPELYKKLISKT